MRHYSLLSRSVYLAPGLACLFGLLCVSCAAFDEGTEADPADEAETPDLAGRWRKVTLESCAEIYPSEMSFREGGIYLVPMEIVQQDPAPIWQSGDYELVGIDGVKIQAANDAMILYSVSATGTGNLVFTDERDCMVEYKRVAE